MVSRSGIWAAKDGKCDFSSPAAARARDRISRCALALADSTLLGHSELSRLSYWSTQGPIGGYRFLSDHMKFTIRSFYTVICAKVKTKRVPSHPIASHRIPLHLTPLSGGAAVRGEEAWGAFASLCGWRFLHHLQYFFRSSFALTIFLLRLV